MSLLEKLSSIELKRRNDEIVVVTTCRGCKEDIDTQPFKGSHKEESLTKSVGTVFLHHAICKNPIEIKEEDKPRDIP